MKLRTCCAGSPVPAQLAVASWEEAYRAGLEGRVSEEDWAAYRVAWCLVGCAPTCAEAVARVAPDGWLYGPAGRVRDWTSEADWLGSLRRVGLENVARGEIRRWRPPRGEA